MDETQVAEELKKKIPEDSKLRVSDAYPDPDPAPEAAPPDHDNLPLENYVLKQEVAEFLGLPRGFRNNPEMANQLEAVLAWAHDVAGSTEPTDILHVLSRRQGEMGIRDKSDKLQRIYQYVKIAKQIDGLYERQRNLNG